MQAYLRLRKPAAHHTAETPLFATLPDTVKSELRALLGVRPGGGAFGSVQRLVNDHLSVRAACLKTLSHYPEWRWTLSRFRARYDLWVTAGDWVALVNRAKAGADWQEREDGLPEDFLWFTASRFSQFAREDGKRQALLSIKRQWRTGRNDAGEREPIPGYGTEPMRVGQRTVHAGTWQDWFSAIGYRQLSMPRSPLPEEAPFPAGWHYANILRQLKASGLFTKATRALAHNGTAAARQLLPGVRGTRAGLRFMEKIQFDDEKTDFRVFDPRTGQVCDLWLLIARDVATNILLGFGVRPARVREDGSQEHLKLRDMKQLLGWLLERFGLPPYLMHWHFERGTATVAKDSAAAIYELLGQDRIECHWTGMVGGISPSGYAEKQIGNPRGKASLESTNRLSRTIASANPGQTGNRWDIRPQDLVSREKECHSIWQRAQAIPEDQRDQVLYPLKTIRQATAEMTRIFSVQNHRTDHDLEAFDEILEWYDETTGKWLPQSSFPSTLNPQPSTPRVRQRKQSPVERAAQLSAGLCWTPVAPEIIAAFYQHTARLVTVKQNGLIECRVNGRPIEFMPPTLHAPDAPRSTVTAGSRLLAYAHPDDPAFLHLTDGKGCFIGTWLRRDRASDQDDISKAIQYAASALKRVREHATALSTEPARLQAMRESNDRLLAASTFIEVAAAPRLAAPKSDKGGSTLNSSVASGLAAITETRTENQQAAHRAAASAADDILASLAAPLAEPKSDEGWKSDEGGSDPSDPSYPSDAASDLLSAMASTSRPAEP